MFLPPFGSIPWVGFSFSTNMFQLFFPNIKSKWWTEKQTKLFASSGNRTRAARVAGEHSTTEPTMLSCCFQGIYFSLFVSGIYGDILFAGLISRRYLLHFHFSVKSAITCSTCSFNRREFINYFSLSILKTFIHKTLFCFNLPLHPQLELQQLKPKSIIGGNHLKLGII